MQKVTLISVPLNSATSAAIDGANESTGADDAGCSDTLDAPADPQRGARSEETNDENAEQRNRTALDERPSDCPN